MATRPNVILGSFEKEEKQVKKKVLFSLIALVLVALIAVPLFAACAPTPAPPGPAAKDKIVVGMARSLSGPLSPIESSGFGPVYGAWVPEVNADGGIFVAEYGKKLPVELKIYDDKSDVGTATRLTEKLILEDKVDFLWSSNSTAMIFAQAPIANKYDYLLLTFEGGATTMRDSLYSLPYVFINLSFSDWYELPVLADMWAKAGVKTAFVTYIADLHGIEYSGVAGTEFGRVGIKILGNVSLPADLKDFAPIITDAKASGADAFCCFGYPDQVMPITGTAMALGYNPKAMIMGPGGNFGFYHTAFGPATEGVCAFATWCRKQSPEMNALFDKLFAGKPEDLQNGWGSDLFWGVLDFQKQAIEKVGTLDQKAVRDVFATEHFNTVLGDTYYTVFGNGGALLAKESHQGEIGQWQNGIFEVVGGGPWPNTKITAPFEYPKPAWPAPAP
jgi:branched-chain amino acid transport system substrate-binding protein